MPDETYACTPIPCPAFEETELKVDHMIAWQGVNIPVIEPAPGFADDHDEQVRTIASMIEQSAQEIRDRYRLGNEYWIRVGLPTNSTLQPILDEIRATGIEGIEFEDAQ